MNPTRVDDSVRSKETKRSEVEDEEMKTVTQIGLAIAGVFLLAGTIAAIVALGQSSHTHTLVNRATHQVSTVRHSNALFAIPVGIFGAGAAGSCLAGVVILETEKKPVKKAGAVEDNDSVESLDQSLKLSETVSEADKKQAETTPTSRIYPILDQ